MKLLWLPVVVALTGQAAPPPTVVRPATAAVQSPRPVPKTYNETADAKALIEAAVHAANTDDIRALVIWGANDNARCDAFDVARRSRDLGTAWSDEYKVAFVDVGRADKNLDLAKTYGVKLDASTLPALTILDQKGKVIANLSSRELATGDGSGFDSQKFAAALVQHQAPQPNAVAQFEEGLKLAKSQDKTLFLWFSAPWCGWCHRLGAWMAQPDVAPVLSKEFVLLKLDFDRGIGAQDIEKRYVDKDQGLPWFAFLGPDGKAVTTSNDEKGANVGHPNAPNEVAHFKVMLQKNKTHLTDAEIDRLIESLVAANVVANRAGG